MWMWNCLGEGGGKGKGELQKEKLTRLRNYKFCNSLKLECGKLYGEK